MSYFSKKTGKEMNMDLLYLETWENWEEFLYNASRFPQLLGEKDEDDVHGIRADIRYAAEDEDKYIKSLLNSGFAGESLMLGLMKDVERLKRIAKEAENEQDASDEQFMDAYEKLIMKFDDFKFRKYEPAKSLGTIP